MFIAIEKELLRNNINIEERKVLKLKEYWDLLLLHQRALHLFSRKDPNKELARQFYDIILLNVFLPEYEELIDAGSGAGFAGIILAILNEQRDYTLVERSEKKGNFLELVAVKLNLNNVRIFKGSIETFESDADVVVSKASCMRKLLEKRLINLVKVGGILVHFTAVPLPSPYKNFPFFNPFREKEAYLSVVERVT